MHTELTRRQLLTYVGAAATIQTFEHFDACCAMAADSKTADKDLFELKPVARWRVCRVAAPRYKVNSTRRSF